MNPTSFSSAPSVALVTNTACVLGHEVARELARRGHDLVLAAPIEPELLGLAGRLRSEFGVNVRPVALDLRKDYAADELFALLTAAGENIDVLANIDDDERVAERFLPVLAARGGRVLDFENHGLTTSDDSASPTPQEIAAAACASLISGEEPVFEPASAPAPEPTTSKPAATEPTPFAAAMPA